MDKKEIITTIIEKDHISFPFKLSEEDKPIIREMIMNRELIFIGFDRKDGNVFTVESCRRGELLLKYG
jgi:hypothetical protein